MKYPCIAALALAWAALTPASADAHASNCTILNGPYCEQAHVLRHHGYQPPVAWPRPVPYQPWTTPTTIPSYYPYWNGGNTYGYPSYGYTIPYRDTGYGTCRIASPFGCRFRAPYYGGY